MSSSPVVAAASSTKPSIPPVGTISIAKEIVVIDEADTAATPRSNKNPPSERDKHKEDSQKNKRRKTYKTVLVEQIHKVQQTMQQANKSLSVNVVRDALEMFENEYCGANSSLSVSERYYIRDILKDTNTAVMFSTCKKKEDKDYFVEQQVESMKRKKEYLNNIFVIINNYY